MEKKPGNKAGKKAAGPMQSKKKIEKDPDDLAHEESHEQPTDAREKDLDDVVHGSYKTRAVKDKDSLEDPDDLVHDYGDDDE